MVAVIGVGGAIAWLVWPRRVTVDPTRYNGHPPPGTPQYDPSAALPVASPTAPLPPAPPPAVSQSSVAIVPLGSFQKQLEDDARARGFVLVRDYEDSVVATARQLQTAGTKVILAPHLQHLASRLEADEAAR